MKEKILSIIENHPRNYPRVIKNIPELYTWIQDNTRGNYPRFVEMIYSAVYNIDLYCDNGNLRKIKRWNKGLSNCGPSSSCPCTKKQISNSVSISKNNQDYTLINNKRKETMIEKYGVEYNSQRKDLKYIWKRSKLDPSIHALLLNKEWMKNEYVIKGRSAVEIAKELDIYYSTVIDYCINHGFDIRKTSNYSLIELEIKDFLVSMGVKVEQHDRSILGNYELDLLLPEYNIAIEVNGLYWHSFNPNTNDEENRDKHIFKTKSCQTQNIDLIHITDWEWKNKQSIIKSIIKSKLGFNNKIYARKCSIREITYQESKDFFNQTHLQGYIPSKYKIGLFYNNQLVEAILIGSNRYGSGYELLRLSSKENITVVGGFSKLLKYAEELINYNELFSYCDLDKFSAKGYLSVGFEIIRETGPGYFWTNGNEIFSRNKCQKSRLKKWLKNYDKTLSESENLFRSGYRRFWNCGNLLLKFKR